MALFGLKSGTFRRELWHYVKRKSARSISADFWAEVALSSRRELTRKSRWYRRWTWSANSNAA